MIRRILFALGYFTLGMGLHAQSLTPSMLSSGGGIATGEYTMLEWTLGEMAVQSINDTDMLFTEGFHQPTLKVEVVESAPFAQEIEEAAAYQVFIQPNPVASVLHIRVEGASEEIVKVELLDASGRRLRRETMLLPEKQLQMQLEDLASGIYFLQIRKQNGSYIKTYKVSKI